MAIRDLQGLGVKSEAMLSEVGIRSVDDFMAANPYAIYQQLANRTGKRNLNLLYAMIGAQQGRHWQDVAKQDKTQILMTLDDMGLAPE